MGPLHNHLWRVAYAGLMPAEYLENRSDVEATRRWEQLIGTLDSGGRSVNGQMVLVAEADERIVGFAMVGPARAREMDGFVELMALYVSPDVQGAGVAQELGQPRAAERPRLPVGARWQPQSPSVLSQARLPTRRRQQVARANRGHRDPHGPTLTSPHTGFAHLLATAVDRNGSRLRRRVSRASRAQILLRFGGLGLLADLPAG